MSRTIEERARLYGWTVAQVIAHDESVKAEVATWPPLTGGQKAVIRTLMGPAGASTQPSAPMRDRKPQPAPEGLPDHQSQQPAEPAVRDAVYLIGSGRDGRVKIGLSGNPQRRARGIATMSAIPVRLLWSTPGGRELELALHEHFKELRLHGEWFDFTGRDAVAEVSAVAELLKARDERHGESQ